MQASDDRQAAGKFGNQPEFQQISRFDPGVQAVKDFLVIAGCSRDETKSVRLGQDVVEPDEGAAADEQDLCGIDQTAVLELDRGPLHDLEQRMLNTFARGSAGLATTCLQLVDLVDENDSALGAGQIAVGSVNQAVQDGLDLVTNELCLGQRSGVGGDERQVKDTCQGFAQQCFAGAGRTDQQDVALGQLNGIQRALGRHSSKVGLDGNRQRALGGILSDHVFIQAMNDFAGFERGWHRYSRVDQEGSMLFPFAVQGKGWTSGERPTRYKPSECSGLRRAGR